MAKNGKKSLNARLLKALRFSDHLNELSSEQRWGLLDRVIMDVLLIDNPNPHRTYAEERGIVEKIKRKLQKEVDARQ